MSTEHVEPGHGDSPAAWTAVILMLVAIAVGTAAFYFSVVWLVWVSAGVTALGPVVGAIMAKAGYGVHGPKFVPKKVEH